MGHNTNINYIELLILLIILFILIGMIIGVYWVYQRVLYYLSIWDSYTAEFNTMKKEFEANFSSIKDGISSLGTNINDIKDSISLLDTNVKNIEDKLNNMPILNNNIL